MKPSTPVHSPPLPNVAFTFSRVWASLLMVFGLVFFLLGLLLLVREIRFGQEALSAIGRVAEVRVSDSGEGPNYTPVVEFTTQGGQTVRFEGQSSTPHAEVGQNVPVLYRREMPQKAHIDTFIQRWLFPCVFVPIGALMILLGFHQRRISRS